MNVDEETEWKREEIGAMVVEREELALLYRCFCIAAVLLFCAAAPVLLLYCGVCTGAVGVLLHCGVCTGAVRVLLCRCCTQHSQIVLCAVLALSLIHI